MADYGKLKEDLIALEETLREKQMEISKKGEAVVAEKDKRTLDEKKLAALAKAITDGTSQLKENELSTPKKRQEIEENLHKMRNKAYIVEAGGGTAAIAGVVATALGATLHLTNTGTGMSDEAFALWQLSNQEVEIRQAKFDLSQAQTNIITILGNRQD